MFRAFALSNLLGGTTRTTQLRYAPASSANTRTSKQQEVNNFIIDQMHKTRGNCHSARKRMIYFAPQLRICNSCQPVPGIKHLCCCVVEKATAVTANNNNSFLVTLSLFCTQKLFLAVSIIMRHVVMLYESKNYVYLPTCRNVLQLCSQTLHHPLAVRICLLSFGPSLYWVNLILEWLMYSQTSLLMKVAISDSSRFFN